jgi:hypothetical protein
MADEAPSRLANLEIKRAAYRHAMREFDEAMKQLADLGPGHSDGTAGIRSAVQKFKDATDQYHTALDAYLGWMRESGRR